VPRQGCRVILAQSRFVLDYRDALFHRRIITDAALSGWYWLAIPAQKGTRHYSS
jgi:hypothetical protein